MIEWDTWTYRFVYTAPFAQRSQSDVDENVYCRDLAASQRITQE
jgi:hypothetical protein